MLSLQTWLVVLVTSTVVKHVGKCLLKEEPSTAASEQLLETDKIKRAAAATILIQFFMGTHVSCIR